MKSPLGIKQEEEEDYNLGDEIHNDLEPPSIHESDVRSIYTYINIIEALTSTNLNCLTRFREMGVTNSMKSPTKKMVHALKKITMQTPSQSHRQ